MVDHKTMYEAYMKQTFQRIKLYRTVAKTYNVQTALYPGSHIDVTPSFVIPNVIYIDNFKGTKPFFNEMDGVISFITTMKEYDATPTVSFYPADYHTTLPIEPVDLIISQYAGFVGQATKQYLKPGGLLLANDSHGDATLAYLDEDYQLIAVVPSGNTLSSSNLDQYFVFPRPRPINEAKVRSTMKGPKYKHQATNYIFQKK